MPIPPATKAILPLVGSLLLFANWRSPVGICLSSHLLSTFVFLLGLLLLPLLSFRSAGPVAYPFVRFAIRFFAAVIFAGAAMLTLLASMALAPDILEFGDDTGFLHRSEIQAGKDWIVAYQIAPGPMASSGTLLRQEREIMLGIRVVRELSYFDHLFEPTMIFAPPGSVEVAFPPEPGITTKYKVQIGPILDQPWTT